MTADTAPDRAQVIDQVVKAYDIRGLVGTQLDATFVRDVGAAYARVLLDEQAAGTGSGLGGGKGLVVGHDMRESSPELADAFTEGVTALGVDVVAIGLASTDMLYYASGALEMPGAMFTASHNPATYNGIKLCRAGAAPVGQDSGLDEIAALLDRGPGAATPDAAAAERGAVSHRDLRDDYAAFLRSLVDLSGIRSLSIVVDAGNGMAGYTVPAVLQGGSGPGHLPIEVYPLYFELDGSFPNHEANPLDPDNLRDLQREVITLGRVDAGLAFDGDADRVFLVDEKGDAVSPSAITALVATRELAKHPGSTVIHNLITSRAVPEIVTEAGGTPVRSRVGHSFIKGTMAETGAVFGGEHSAHYYFRDFWRADSGMLAALHVLAALGEQDRPLSELMARYERYAASGEINSTVADPTAVMAEVEQTFGDRDGVTTDDLDGLTVTLPATGDRAGSWFNLRPSNTEPLLRLNVEAADDDAVAALRDEVLALVRG
ncbi:phosphomannomutase/phosphoglucomutase [Actinomycetospora sp. NBRC 106375]|uniref:phosphomannomutase/phosphoglucomutase n=1 Tax=Actinomycetospora sp. NBRC 106375 TaxID=3032207 RepID=UPI0024A1014D|nr:phosphomannomutase/phosphoglucomutase [Actinomycetospora sp. NBRC 106375]GLZ50037.1 phosphomannomutase/phosphoglucomutase [Actinomycetospora sp. NBRC 106375]